MVDREIPDTIIVVNLCIMSIYKPRNKTKKIGIIKAIGAGLLYKTFFGIIILLHKPSLDKCNLVINPFVQGPRNLQNTRSAANIFRSKAPL